MSGHRKCFCVGILLGTIKMWQFPFIPLLDCCIYWSLLYLLKFVVFIKVYPCIFTLSDLTLFQGHDVRRLNIGFFMHIMLFFFFFCVLFLTFKACIQGRWFTCFLTPQQPYCWLSVKHCLKNILQALDAWALSIDFVSTCPFFYFYFLFVHVCVFKTKEFLSTKALFAKNAS